MNNRATTFKVQGEHAGITYRCPGCGSLHSVYTEKSKHPTAMPWNGSLEEPTLVGTVFAYWKGCSEFNCTSKGEDGECTDPAHNRRHVCRHTLKKGHVTFTDACTGSHRSKTVQLAPEF